MRTKLDGIRGLIVLGAFSVLWALVGSGCAEMFVVQHRDAGIQAHAIQAQALENGGIGVGVDLLSITPGWLAAWKDTPGAMGAATVADLGTTAAAVWAGYKAVHQSSSGSSGAGGGVSVGGNNNTVIVNGAGTQSYHTESSP